MVCLCNKLTFSVLFQETMCRCITSRPDTVNPLNFTYGFVGSCFVVVTLQFWVHSWNKFTYIRQGCFTVTVENAMIQIARPVGSEVAREKVGNTVKPVCNDHLYNKIYFLWFIQ